MCGRSKWSLLCAVSSGHLLWLEFGFWFRFRFWIVCSKAASSGINVTQGSIARNDSKFIQIHRAYIHFGMGKTEEHLHVDTTNHLGKQTRRRSRTPASQVAIQGSGTTRPYMETLPSPPPRQPIQRSQDTRPHVDVSQTDRQLTCEAGIPRPHMTLMEMHLSLCPRPPAQEAGTARSHIETLPFPTSRQPIQTKEATCSHVRRQQHSTTTPPASASQRPPRANR